MTDLRERSRQRDVTADSTRASTVFRCIEYHRNADFTVFLWSLPISVSHRFGSSTWSRHCILRMYEAVTKVKARQDCLTCRSRAHLLKPFRDISMPSLATTVFTGRT